MDPFVHRVIDATIENTRRLLAERAVSWENARRGVISVINDLSARYPDDAPAIKSVLAEFVLAWDDLHKQCGRRRHRRIIPLNNRAVLLVGGRKVEAEVLNISESGVGLGTVVRPPIGDDAVLGETPLKVVRHFRGGIAGQFHQPLPSDVIRAAIRL